MTDTSTHSFIFSAFFEPRIARLLWREEERFGKYKIVEWPYVLYDMEIRPGDLEHASLILASTLQETDLAIFGEKIHMNLSLWEEAHNPAYDVYGDPVDSSPHEEALAYAVDDILEVLKDAKKDGLDIVTGVG